MKAWYRLYKPLVNFAGILLIALILGLGGCGASQSELDRIGKKTTYSATLVEAYSTYQKCGHKGRSDCEVFMGRLMLDKGGQIDRELDGFLYHSFVKSGGKPERADVRLSPRDFGERPTLVMFSLAFVGIMSLFVSCVIIFYGFIALPDIYKDHKRNIRNVR